MWVVIWTSNTTRRCNTMTNKQDTDEPTAVGQTRYGKHSKPPIRFQPLWTIWVNQPAIPNTRGNRTCLKPAASNESFVGLLNLRCFAYAYCILFHTWSDHATTMSTTCDNTADTYCKQHVCNEWVTWFCLCLLGNAWRIPVTMFTESVGTHSKTQLL